MTITRVVDKYNSSKIWVIKRYKNGNFYINQEINSRLFSKRFSRTTKTKLIEIGVIL